MIMPVDIVSSDQGSPLCSVFGTCGGCQYQDISYEEELRIKNEFLRDLLARAGMLADPSVLDPVVPSPRIYHYRSRLDLRLLKTGDQNVFVGFTARDRKQLVEIGACPIAMPAVSDFLPELKRLASEKLPVKYRNANLVVKTGDDGRVHWGGIGRRSLKMAEDDFFWTEVDGRRIHYGLDSFFQANLSILPELFRRIRAMGILSSRTRLYDIYGGVGLFGICLGAEVGEVLLLEENIHAVTTARYNARYNGFTNFFFYEGRMEDHAVVFAGITSPSVAVIDPPRNGLSPSACDLLCAAAFDHLLYLSCNPQSMTRDLSRFLESGWQILKIIPFDFFPRTKHIETLIQLRRNG